MHSPHNNPLALFVKGKLMEVENFSHQSFHTVNGKKLFPFDTYFNENLNYMKCIHIMNMNDECFLSECVSNLCDADDKVKNFSLTL